MIISIIIVIISLFLDGILSNFLPYLINDLSLFTPLFTLVSIFIIYPFFKKKEKKYLITIFIIGIIYDLFYTNLLFFNGVLFFIIGLLTIYFYKIYEMNSIKLLIYIILVITIYEVLTASILLVFNIVPITFYKVIYKISHSLILNIIYGELLYLIIKIIPKKHKKISIN